MSFRFLLEFRIEGSAANWLPSARGSIALSCVPALILLHPFLQTLAPDVKATQEAKLAELRKVADAHAHSELERKLALRYHKIKFFGEQVVHRDSAVACFAHQPTFLSLSEQCAKMICGSKCQTYVSVSLLLGNEIDRNR